MIAIDTSALIAIVKNEPLAESCAAVLERSTVRLILSAATMTEAIIVAEGKMVRAGLDDLLRSLPLEIIDLTTLRARHAADAYRAYGKNFHPAALNFGDCFSYATAKEFDCPLLYIGNDFARTDVRSALAST